MRLHLLMVANTHDFSIGDSCEVDANNITAMMEEAAECLEVELVTRTIKGGDFTYENIQEAVTSMDPGTNDAVVFWYSGHGFRTPGKEERWPYIAVDSEEDGSLSGIGEDEVFRLLKDKDPRFLMVLCDCCNAVMDVEVYEHFGTREPAGPVDVTRNYRRLFAESRGTILATSSQPGEFSVGTSVEGGLFTVSFLSALREAVRSPGDADWEEILAHGSAPHEVANNDSGYQTPIYEVDLGARVRSWTKSGQKKAAAKTGGKVKARGRVLGPARRSGYGALLFLGIAVLATLGAGAWFERVPLAVDVAGGIVLLWSAWRGFQIGFLEEVGRVASWVLPGAGALWALNPLDTALLEQVSAEIPFRRYLLFGVLFAVMFLVLRFLLGKVSDGRRASTLDGLLGTGVGALMGVAWVYIATVGTLGVGNAMGWSPPIQGSYVGTFSQLYNVFNQDTVTEARALIEAEERWKMPANPAVAAFFGEEGSRLLEGADTLEAWGLTYKDSQSKGRLGKYRTTGQVESVPSGALAALRQALSDEGMYEFDTIARVPFKPSQALVLKAGEEQLTLLLDLDRMKMGWTLGDARGLCDLKKKSAGFKALVALVDQVFGGAAK